jgi:Rad3-related DNA helicase
MDNEIVNYFPMPEFRPKQKEVLLKCHELFESGKRLILLQAPVGFGKSAVNTALCRYYQPSLYTTPQLSLIDQILNDKYLGKYFVEIKGRDNYRCAKDNYLIPVRYGLCKREKDVIPDRCNWLVECPYYSQKFKAIKSPIALMSTAYYIVDAFQEEPNFSNRNLVVVDEGHFLSEYVGDHISLEVSRRTLPEEVWKICKHNPTNIQTIIGLVQDYISRKQQKLDENGSLTEEEVREKDKAVEWLSKALRYIETEMLAEWIWVDKNGGKIAKPVYSRWFMEQMVWSRGKKFLISTATIIKPKVWIYETGADLVFTNDEMAFIDVGMTFPPENRRVYDMSIGSMKYSEQEVNRKHAARMLEYIIKTFKGKNIAVHFPSYRLAKEIYDLIEDVSNIYLPNSENRDEILERWKRNGGVLFAVAYHEGQDWKYDTCQIQVLVKTLYPDATDPVVQRRLEKKDYQWLMWTALVKCIQAYGRAIRAEDDYMEFYVLDETFWDLLKRNWPDIPKWFKEVVPLHRWPKKYRKQIQNVEGKVGNNANEETK